MREEITAIVTRFYHRPAQVRIRGILADSFAKLSFRSLSRIELDLERLALEAAYSYICWEILIAEYQIAYESPVET
jgi:hypothetical protein